MRNLSQFQFMYEVPVVHYPGSQRFAKAAFRLGARARTLCPDTKRNVVQTLWCHKFPFNLVQCCHLLSATTNHSETWVKSMALMKSCFRQVPVPTDSTCMNTTFGESARTRVLCSSFCTGTIKMLRSLWCPCPSTEPGHQVRTRPKRRAMKCDKRSAKQWRERK